jgi:hypothetical protein
MAKQTFTTGQVLTAAQMTDLQQTAMTGGAASTKTVSYVLVAADAGTRIAMNAAGSTTITVNTGLFSAGDTVSIQNIGAGVCTVTAGTATVNTSGSLVLAQYQGGILYFTSASAAIFFQFATPASGDIEGVTAGTGISGGGTSGTVTITNDMATTITASGDIVVGTGNGTYDNLPIGSTGQVLTADTTVSPYKVKWATAGASSFCGAFVRKATKQVIATSTVTEITWNTEVFDTDNIHSNTTNTNRFTIPTGKSGYWLFSTSVTWDNMDTGGRRLYLVKNGGTYQATARNDNVNSDYWTQTANAIFNCTAGDYLSVQVYQQSGGNIDLWGDDLGNDVSWVYCAYLGA